jgi:regulator of ribonuclease activity A
MAADAERERAALEWAEALMQDAGLGSAAQHQSQPAGDRMNKPLTDFATVDLVDAHRANVKSCPVQFRNYGGRMAFAGPVRTVLCHQDNALIRQVLSEPGDGTILVIDGGGSLGAALIGDVMAGLGQTNGWAGAIINGAVRDVGALREMAFGVKALGSNPMVSDKTGAGAADVPVVIGGVLIRPGMWAYCDEDGVLLSESRL